jgi:hypothetical protein
LKHTSKLHIQTASVIDPLKCLFSPITSCDGNNCPSITIVLFSLQIITQWCVTENNNVHQQEPHVHHVRTAEHQPVRADQEEQVPGLQPPAGAKVCALSAAVPRPALQEQDHPLRHEAGERLAQAAGEEWNKGRISHHWHLLFLKRMYPSILSFETINKLKLFFECGIPRPQDVGHLCLRYCNFFNPFYNLNCSA